MKECYISVVDEYKKKTEKFRADYSTFFTQDENLTIAQKQINARIKDLSVSWFFIMQYQYTPDNNLYGYKFSFRIK